jgi:hypothetical protein
MMNKLMTTAGIFRHYRDIANDAQRQPKTEVTLSDLDCFDDNPLSYMAFHEVMDRCVSNSCVELLRYLSCLHV